VLYILWRFRAKPNQVEEFQRTYAGDGDWAKLFARAPGYQGTDLLADTDDPLAFVVIDRWTTRALTSISENGMARSTRLWITSAVS